MVRSPSPYRRWVTVIIATALAAVMTPVVANARNVSPITPFLLKAGEVRGITPGKVQVFRAASAVRNGAGEIRTEPEIRRYETEGFVEAALVRIHDLAEPMARGVSTVFEFKTSAGAQAEMHVELKEELDPDVLRREGVFKYLALRHFKAPGVPEVRAYAFVTNRAAEKLGLESGIAHGLFVQGTCLFSIGILRPASNYVIEPVRTGIQAIAGRVDGTCPSGV